MKIESRLARAERWADAHKPEPSFAVVYVLPDSNDEGLSYAEIIASAEMKTLPFNDLLNEDGSFREGFYFKRFASCNLSDVKRLLNAWDIEAHRAANEKEAGREG